MEWEGGGKALEAMSGDNYHNYLYFYYVYVIDIPATTSPVGYRMIPPGGGRVLSSRPVIYSGGLGRQNPHRGPVAAVWSKPGQWVPHNPHIVR